MLNFVVLMFLVYLYLLLNTWYVWDWSRVSHIFYIKLIYGTYIYYQTVTMATKATNYMDNGQRPKYGYYIWTL